MRGPQRQGELLLGDLWRAPEGEQPAGPLGATAAGLFLAAHQISMSELLVAHPPAGFTFCSIFILHQASRDNCD